jgi:hypothetical protein
MAVLARWGTVGCPAGVCNTAVRIEDLLEIWLGLLNELLQLGNLANLLVCEDLILLVSINTKTCRIITTVFETC